MSNFFQHAPVQDTHQKRFLEALLHRQHVIASLPLNVPVTSLYALPAMMGNGMTVAICPGQSQIRRNLEYFKSAGFKFPEVSFLDGSQMPHEERAIEQDINRGRIRLLYITPERFASLTFLERFVHAEVPCLIIEEAERLLPAMPGHTAYKKLYEDGLALLGKLPPLALLTPPLPPVRLGELQERLHLPGYHAIQYSPLIEGIDLRVECLFTEHQKFRKLINALTGSTGPGRLGRLDNAGSVLIQTAFPAQAEKLAGTLINYGFEHVWPAHYKKSPREQAQLSELAATRMNTIIVNAGLEPRFWNPPPEARPRVVFWNPPANVEDLFLQVFRQSPSVQAAYSERHFMRSLVLYTKEDLQAAIQRLQPSRYLDAEDIRERQRALRHYRGWVLSDSCRLQTLAAYYQGSTSVEIPPCGKCDRCEERPVGKRVAGRRIAEPVRHALRRWFF